MNKEDILGAQGEDSVRNPRMNREAIERVFWPFTVLLALFGVGLQLMPTVSMASIPEEAWQFGARTNSFQYVSIDREEPGRTGISIFKRNEVSVPAKATVLGVMVDGQPRAYLADGMSRPEWHLAHDQLGGREVTVSYCNWTQCAQVFDRQAKAPEAISLAGFRKGHLRLKVDDVAYNQTSEELPLEKLPVVQMAWDDWQTLHPSTDIFLGDKAADFALPHATGERLD